MRTNSLTVGEFVQIVLSGGTRLGIRGETAADHNRLPPSGGTRDRMTTTEVGLALGAAVVLGLLTWFVVGRLLAGTDRLSERAVTGVSAALLFLGPLAVLAALVAATVAGGWLQGSGAVDLLTWFFLAMAVGLLDAVWVARTRAVPVLTDSEGVDVPETVLSAIRTGTLAGGVLSALGFLGLAVTELTTQPGPVGEFSRAVPQGPVVLVGFLIGAPIFCLAYGALVALYLRVTVIKPA